jgi:hypothetical protein
MRSPDSMSQFHPIPPHRPDGYVSRLRRRANRGMTLAETMIATLVFSMGILGVYAMMLKSYELVTLARHRDNGRALLISFADQFLRLQTTDQGTNGSVNPRPLFILTTLTGPTGTGLSWTDTSGASGVLQPDGLHVFLGEAGSSQVEAVVTRFVSAVDTANGNSVASESPTSAGWMLQGTFAISYTIRGRLQTQSLTVARAVP